MKIQILNLCLTLRPHGLQPTWVLCSWNSPGKITGVDCHSLLQGIFSTQRSNPGPPALQADSLLSEPPGKPLVDLRAPLFLSAVSCSYVQILHIFSLICHYFEPSEKVFLIFIFLLFVAIGFIIYFFVILPSHFANIEGNARISLKAIIVY